MTDRPDKSRNHAIDFLKCASILYIVGGWHLFNYAPDFPSYNNHISNRVTVVVLGLFVLISGYLLGSKPVSWRKDDLLAFYKKRLLRIYPPYIIAVALFAVMDIASDASLIKSIFLLSTLHGPAPFTLWYIVMLLCFYVCAPVLIMLRDRPKVFLAASTALTCGLMALSLYGSAIPNMAIYFPAFATGVFLAAHSIRLTRRHWALLSVAAVIAFLLPYQDMAEGIIAEHSLWSIPLALLLPGIIFYTALKLPGHLVRNPLFHLISYSSFFMYLFHRPVYIAMTELYLPETAIGQTLYLAGLCLPLVIAVSYGGQKAYDSVIAKRQA